MNHASMMLIPVCVVRHQILVCGGGGHWGLGSDYFCTTLVEYENIVYSYASTLGVQVVVSELS